MVDGQKTINDYPCGEQSANTTSWLGYNGYSGANYFQGDISEVLIL